MKSIMHDALEFIDRCKEENIKPMLEMVSAKFKVKIHRDESGNYICKFPKNCLFKTIDKQTSCIPVDDVYPDKNAVIFDEKCSVKIPERYRDIGYTSITTIEKYMRIVVMDFRNKSAKLIFGNLEESKYVEYPKYNKRIYVTENNEYFDLLQFCNSEKHLVASINEEIYCCYSYNTYGKHLNNFTVAKEIQPNLVLYYMFNHNIVEYGIMDKITNNILLSYVASKKQPDMFCMVLTDKIFDIGKYQLPRVLQKLGYTPTSKFCNVIVPPEIIIKAKEHISYMLDILPADKFCCTFNFNDYFIKIESHELSSCTLDVYCQCSKNHPWTKIGEMLIADDGAERKITKFKYTVTNNVIIWLDFTATVPKITLIVPVDNNKYRNFTIERKYDCSVVLIWSDHFNCSFHCDNNQKRLSLSHVPIQKNNAYQKENEIILTTINLLIKLESNEFAGINELDL